MDYIALRVGTTLHFDTYLIEKVLGKGGFGITYLARDLKLDKLVAIKEFFPSSLCSRDGSTNHITLGTQSSNELVSHLKEKFLKEARNIAKLNHPNIIKIFSAFEDNNTAYYVMEYIEGESLEQRVINNGPLSWQYAARFINPIGHALEYLHENHMTHFDVKPANIMVRSSDNSPILIDFGLSKNYDSSGHQTTVHGPLGVSPGYSPIEQYNMGSSAEFSPKSDLYSLAATLYFILTALHPQEATTNVVDSLTFPAAVPANVKEAIVRAMAMFPEQRHETVAHFLSELNNPNAFKKSDFAHQTVRHTAPPTIVETQNTISESPQHSQRQISKSNSSNNTVIIAGICGFVFIVVFVLWLLIGKDKKDETSYAPIVEAATAETPTEQPVASNNEVTAEVVSEASPYGPFSDRNEIIDYIRDYQDDISHTVPITSKFSSTFVTNYGTPTTFTPNSYIKETETYRNRIGYVAGSHDYDWSSLQFNSDGEGGVVAKYDHVYDLTTDKEGDYKVRRFGLTTTLHINSNRKIYLVEEKTKKL